MIKLTPKPISLRVISFDNWKEILTEGWVNSRPQLVGTVIDFNEVLKIDTPVSELAGFTAEFTVPILFREIICSARDHVVWARTSRVDNLIENWNVVEGISVDGLVDIQMLADKLLTESKSDSQDEFRKNLPLSYMTSFTTRLNLRSALKLVKYFRYLQQYEPIKDAAISFTKKLSGILQNKGIYVEKLLEVLKLDDYCPMVNNKDSNYIDLKDHVIIEGDYSVMLRAQIIRHRLLHVVDDLKKYFSMPNVWSIPVSDKMHISIGATKSSWQSIIAKRMCWLAHSSIWADIINDFASTNSNVIADLIPCKDGKCPYNEDCHQRNIKNDPGLPCPRNLHLGEYSEFDVIDNNFDVDDLVVEMDKYVEKSGRPKGYWGNEISKFINKSGE